MSISSLVATNSALAITYGELDQGRHPYVGLMVAQDADGNPHWRCSGTLIAPKLFLTAGHCVEAPAAHVEIWLDDDVDAGIPGNGYPYKGDVGGDPHTHPNYVSNAFYLHDLGVVELDRPYKLKTYARLPELPERGELPLLDELAADGKHNVEFTTVGYGDQRIHPVFEEVARVRMVAYPYLVQINTASTGDFSVLLSNNHSTGGTCFGDSGGPNFIGDSDVIGGVTSFGLNGQCAGTGGVYRVDQEDDLNWLYGTYGRMLDW